EAVHAGLRGGIRGAAGVVRGPRGPLARARRDADDLAVPLLDHVFRRGARAEERRAEVQTDDAVPRLLGHLPDARGAAAADHVDEDVDAAESLDRRVDETARRQ